MSLWRSLFGASLKPPDTIKPISTTPIADRKLSLIPWGGIFSFGLLFALPLTLLLIYGQPALRIKYTYSGPYQNPSRYHQCDYITLFDGWRDVRPLFGHCPLITTVPFKLEHLIGA